SEHERQASGVEALAHQLLEAVLDDRDLAVRQGLDPVGEHVGTDDLVAEMGQTGSCGETDVSGAEDRDLRHHPIIPRTSLSMGACQSARSGSPAAASARLSSTELAGRGASRGGSRSEVAIGSTRPGSIPAAARTSRARPNQLVAPWLVTWNTPGARDR